VPDTPSYTIGCNRDLPAAAGRRGGSQWLVSSCSDDRTVVLRAVNDSPAFPRLITIAPSPEGYNIDGRGRGDRQATEAAMTELAELSVTDVRALIAETKQLQKTRRRAAIAFQ
jgi:hypothetical protein